MNPEILILILILPLLYAALILCFFTGWLRTEVFTPGPDFIDTKVTILIPCRNESQNINMLERLLVEQDYPSRLMEVLWIDDHSDDETGRILDQIARENECHRVVRLSGEEKGKKAALLAGAELAKGELILLTDADSRPGQGWVKSMASFYKTNGADLIIGPVLLDPSTTLTDKLQKLEYMSLSMSGAGSAGIGLPVLAQGPNIGVRAQLYKQLATDLDDRFKSGDDVFLLQGVKQIRGTHIAFIRNSQAFVTTDPSPGWQQFLNQRIRWASKAKGYKDPMMIFTSLLVLLVNIEILATLAGVAAGWVSMEIPLIIIGVKIMVDLPLLLSGLLFYRCLNLAWWILPGQIIYPFYILLVSTRSLYGSISWKGRNS